MKKLLTLLTLLSACTLHAATRSYKQPASDRAPSLGGGMRGYVDTAAGMARAGVSYADEGINVFEREAGEVRDAFDAAGAEAKAIGGEVAGVAKRGAQAAGRVRTTAHALARNLDDVKRQLGQLSHSMNFDTVDKTIAVGTATALSGALAYQAWREYRAIRRKYPNISKSEMLTRLVRGTYYRAIRALGGKEGAVLQVLEIASVLGMLALTGRYIYKNRQRVASQAKQYWDDGASSTGFTPYDAQSVVSDDSDLMELAADDGELFTRHVRDDAASMLRE